MYQPRDNVRVLFEVFDGLHQGLHFLYIIVRQMDDMIAAGEKKGQGGEKGRLQGCTEQFLRKIQRIVNRAVVTHPLGYDARTDGAEAARLCVVGGAANTEFSSCTRIGDAYPIGKGPEGELDGGPFIRVLVGQEIWYIKAMRMLFL